MRAALFVPLALALVPVLAPSAARAQDHAAALAGAASENAGTLQQLGSACQGVSSCAVTVTLNLRKQDGTVARRLVPLGDLGGGYFYVAELYRGKSYASRARVVRIAGGAMEECQERTQYSTEAPLLIRWTIDGPESRSADIDPADCCEIARRYRGYTVDPTIHSTNLVLQDCPAGWLPAVQSARKGRADRKLSGSKLR